MKQEQIKPGVKIIANKNFTSFGRVKVKKGDIFTIEIGSGSKNLGWHVKELEKIFGWTFSIPEDINNFDLYKEGVIKEKDGIKVGDRVKFNKDGKTYYGYVAVIDQGVTAFPYLLRLNSFNGDTGKTYWNKNWYPKNEKKHEKNLIWTLKKNFEVIKEENKEEHQNNKPLNNNLIKKTMNKAIKIVQNIGLSKDDKLKIKFDIIDEDKNLTEQGVYTYLEMEAKERKYNSYIDMREKLGYPEGEQSMISTFELDSLVKKHDEALLRELTKEAEKEE